jgi:sentrin-specific protease 1
MWLIPICEWRRSHWTLVAADFSAGTLTYYDSFGSYNKTVLADIRSYIEQLYEHRRPSSPLPEMNFQKGNTPRQMNGYDCGAFVCRFSETLLKGEDLNPSSFSQDDMGNYRNYLRQRIANYKPVSQ